MRAYHVVAIRTRPSGESKTYNDRDSGDAQRSLHHPSQNDAAPARPLPA